jgi:hypothetical protein
MGIFLFRGAWLPYDTDGLSVASSIETESRLPYVLDPQVPLPHGAARQKLHGIDGAVVALGDGDNFFICA